MRKIVFEKVSKTIKKYNLLSKNDRIVIAISGGADSVGLTYLLWCLKKKYALKLHLFHFRHGLRGKKAENEDLKLVKSLAKKLFLPLTVKRIKVKEFAQKKKVGLEEAARILRYQCLTEFAKEHNFNKIATGHTLDDQAETVLFNLIRGTGLTGLSGIPVYREEKTTSIIRPLLRITKNEILQYLKKENLSYSEDLTNFQLNYTRNRIRNELIPLLEKYNPRIKEHLANLAETITENKISQDKELKKILPFLIKKQETKIKLDLRNFLCYNKNVQKEVINHLLEHYGKKSFAHFNALNNLINRKESGKQIDLGKGWQAEKKNNQVYFWKK